MSDLFSNCPEGLAANEGWHALAFQKGFLDVVPNWAVFTLLLFAHLGFSTIFLFSHYFQKHFKQAGKAFASVLIIVPGVMIVAGAVFLYVFTHPPERPQTVEFDFFINGKAVTNGSVVILPPDRKFTIAARNISNTSFSETTLLFMPPIGSEYFVADQWQVSGSGDWVDGTNSAIVPIFSTTSSFVLGNFMRFASGTIQVSEKLSGIKAKVSAHAIGVRTHELYVYIYPPPP